jgi:hypothetical protein
MHPVYFLPLGSRTRFYTHKKQQIKLLFFVYLIFRFTEKKREVEIFWIERQKAFPEHTPLGDFYSAYNSEVGTWNEILLSECFKTPNR